MLLKASLILVCCLATLATALEDEMATFSAFGEPLNSGLIMTVRQELNSRIDSIWVNHPASTVCAGCLISSWYVNTGSSVARTFHTSQIDAALAGMPGDLISKVKTIVFANRVVFEMFRTTVGAPSANGHYLQYLGIARRSGDYVELAIVRGEVSGHLVQKHGVHHYRSCGRILWWECCCKDHYVHYPRGFMASEILQIETAMRAETVRRLRERAQDISF